jgi:two-component system phosphate regulon sensor histidine kinase PhoR
MYGSAQNDKNPRSERELADLHALTHVILRINRSLDLDEVLRASLNGIQRVVSGRAGCFILLNPGDRTLRLSHAFGLSTALLEKLQHLPLDLVPSDDPNNEDQLDIIPAIGERIEGILKNQSVEPFILIPLTALRRPVGVLLVLTETGGLLQPNSVDLMMSIGEQIGLAIENARLHTSVKEAEEWRRDFMENSLNAFWEGDFAGRITYVNDAACKLLGYGRAELLKMRPADFIVDDEASRRAVIVDLRDKGFIENRDAKIVTKTGETRTINYSTRIVRNSQGTNVRFQSTSHDVTMRRKLTEELRYRTEELTALNKIAEILNHPLELERSLNRVCEQIVSITGMEGTAIVMVDGSRQFLHLVAHYGIADSLISLAQHLGLDDPLTRSIFEGDGLAIDDVMLFDQPGFEGPRAEGYHAGICMPIKIERIPIGILFVGSKVRTKYEPSDVALLRNISSQIAVALENSNLYNQMQRRMKELDGLAKLSMACTASLDPARLSEIAVIWTQRLLPSDLCSIRLIENDAMRILAGSVYSQTPLKRDIELDNVFRRVVEKRDTCTITDVENEADLPQAHRDGFRGIGIRSFVAVPMPVPDGVIGILGLGRAIPHVWQPGEIELLQTIANQTANAIHNAVLFQNVLREQRKVQAIFDSGLSGLYATDAQDQLVMFNRAAERVTGWKSSEVQGMTWQEIFGDPEPLYRKALNEKASIFNLQGRAYKTHDGREIPIAEAVAPLMNEQGSVIGAVGAFWDLTKEKQAEESRARFLQMVAHQLRNPLSSLLSSLQLLERRGISAKKRAELWRIVKIEGTRLKEFSDQFLDLEAEIKSPRPLQVETLSMGELVRQVVHEFAIGKPEHRFRVKLPKPEPIAYADAWRVANVLRNLLDNAAGYSPAGTFVTVSVRLLDDKTIDVAVKDQGEGVPLEDRENIFKQFYRSSKAGGRRTYGHGLGLYIAKDMVGEMGGGIWVDSKSNQGATFHFSLRRAE